MPPKKFITRRKVYRKKGPRKGYTTRKYNNRRGAKFTNVRKNLYYFKRKVAPGTQINLTLQQRGQLSFSLDQVPSPADFTALFDQYMITGVKVDFRLILDPSAQAFGSATYPNLYIRRDYDNTATETIQEIAQDNKSKRFILRPNSVSSIYIKPALQAEYFNTATGLTDKSPVWNKWFDCGNTNMQHLGIKWAIDTMGILLTPGNTMSIEYTYYLAFKNTR